jgi:hypothetical protein
MFKLADTLMIEIETHPVNIEEFRFLMGDEVLALSEKLQSAAQRNARAEFSA